MILRDIFIKIDEKRIIKRLGHKKGMEIQKNIQDKIAENIIIAKSLIDSALSMQTIKLLDKDNDRLIFESGFVIEGEKIVDYLSNCSKLTVYSATIGDALENNLVKADALDALILDMIGSEATEQIARWFYRNLKLKGHLLTKRKSPGYMDFSLDLQPKILEISGGHNLGITANENNMLIPRKSTTGVIGWLDST